MKVEWTRAQVDEIENNAYTVGILTGERMERSRMEKIVEAGEENRQADIELGRRLERERIAWCLRKLAENVLRPSEYRDGYLQAADDVEADNWPIEWPGRIKGENG